MDSRREFIKKALALSGAAGLSSVLPPSIQRALAINPAAGSTFLDAEHIVIIMQENRSFDHCFGTLQGVRGFNDPRAIELPNKNKVWLQTDAKGQTYTPFRLNIKDTKATWMGSLPHSWPDQVDARNWGHHDQWLQAKQSGHPDYKEMPLTMGYYNREDLPFYYSLADAFTVCDQNFCSSLTGTTPNRLHLWTGTLRGEKNPETQARVRNSELDYDRPAHWTTFPERLEEHGLSWKVYQNEISVGVGFTGEEDAWLANFTDNPLEWFSQYHVKFHPAYIQNLPKRIQQLEREIQDLTKSLNTAGANAQDTQKDSARLAARQKELAECRDELKILTPENFAKLSALEKALHAKGFTNNISDPDYHSLASLPLENDAEKEMKMPKGDVLFQFRKDVKENKLPLVSWLVAPENFSDHPGAPWYGAWYVSEVMDILTHDPDVWKKTVFILCYDENDGYFDHVPPFVPTHPSLKNGAMSANLDARTEYVTREQDQRYNSPEASRESPIGLGYRVPLVIASPWSRGGVVNSQVFDHTSILQLLEKFASHKAGKEIRESNISDWRRTVCGDLTSVFSPYENQSIKLPAFLNHNAVLKDIHQAKHKVLPQGFKPLTQPEVHQLNKGLTSLSFSQESGVRPANALPYELYAHGTLNDDRKSVLLDFAAGNTFFGVASAGVPYLVYGTGNMKPRAYTVRSGDKIQDNWNLSDFDGGQYALRVYGPNGFYRQWNGDAKDPLLAVNLSYEQKGKDITGNIILTIENKDLKGHTLTIHDISYKQQDVVKTIAAGQRATVVLDLSKSLHWYDIAVLAKGFAHFSKRFAGRVETGKSGFTDPLMGHALS
jgi:phospholipase C